MALHCTDWCSAIFTILFIYDIQNEKENEDRFIGLKFTVVSTLEWIGAAFTAYYSIHLMGQNVSLSTVFGVFLFRPLPVSLV